MCKRQSPHFPHDVEAEIGGGIGVSAPMIVAVEEDAPVLARPRDISACLLKLQVCLVLWVGFSNDGDNESLSHLNSIPCSMQVLSKWIRWVAYPLD